MRITRLPDGRWWCDGYVAGKRKRGTFISRALAEAYKAQCERQSFNRKHGIAEMSATQLAIAQELFRRLPPDVDVLKLVDDYLITHRVKNRIPLELGIEQFLDRLRTNNKRPQYIKSIGKPLRRLNRYFQSMVMICDITKDDILKFLDTSIVATPANGYHYLNDFAVFFNYCVREGHCAVSPIKNIQKPTLDYTEPWVLRLQQCQDLLSNTSGQVRAYSALALGCGIRPMELLRMDWSLVDLEGATVRVPAALSKTRTLG